MNLLDGKKAADAKAVRYRAAYMYARSLFGNALSRSKGDAPIGLFVGHVLRVNPALTATPAIGKDGRRGFALVSTAESKKLGVPHAKVDDPVVCAHVYGSEINRTATSFYTTYRRLFTTPNANYWKCVYLRNTLGVATFNHLWAAANPHIAYTNTPVMEAGNWTLENKLVADATDKAYAWLTMYVDRLDKAPSGWVLSNLKHLILHDCEYVYALWRRYGNSRPAGFGKLPAFDERYKLDYVSRTV